MLTSSSDSLRKLGTGSFNLTASHMDKKEKSQTSESDAHMELDLGQEMLASRRELKLKNIWKMVSSLMCKALKSLV